MQACSRCGTQVRSAAKFCYSCGAAIEPAPSAPPVAEPGQRPQRTGGGTRFVLAGAGIVGVAVIGIGVAAFALLGGDGTDAPGGTAGGDQTAARTASPTVAPLPTATPAMVEVTKSYPVSASYSGRPAAGFKVASVEVQPKTVVVLASSRIHSEMPASLSTETIDLTGATRDIVQEVLLILPTGASIEGSATVTVRVRLEVGLAAGVTVQVGELEPCLNLRVTAGVDAEVVGDEVCLVEGTVARILDGPADADGYTWWRLRVETGEYRGTTGWSAERDLKDGGGKRWLLPVVE